VLLVLIVASAGADRKEAGPDVPPIADVDSVVLALGAPIDGPGCSALTWLIRVDLGRGSWVRDETRCTAGPKPTVTKLTGTFDPATRTAFEAAYSKLDERVPKLCLQGKEQVLTAVIHTKNGKTVQFVDRGCENPARLRELGALLLALKPAP
jgi:hypothetical protein